MFEIKMWPIAELQFFERYPDIIDSLFYSSERDNYKYHRNILNRPPVVSVHLQKTSLAVLVI